MRYSLLALFFLQVLGLGSCNQGPKTSETTNAAPTDTSTEIQGGAQTTVVASTPPKDASLLTGSSIDSQSIQLSWKDNSTNEDFFLLERQTTNGKDPFAQIAKIAANTTKYLDKTAVAGVTYNYRLRASNAFADSDYTDVVAIQTKAQIIGFLGDSITYGQGCTATDCPNAVITEVNLLKAKGRTVTYVNRGHKGATTVDWQPAGILLAPAIAAFTAAKVETVSIMLGTNDSRTTARTTATNYKKNIQTIIAKLLDPATGIKHVILNEPPYAVPGSVSGTVDATSDKLLQQYPLQLDAITNAAKGDRTAYAYFLKNKSLLRDGVHPTTAGHAALGQLWATALLGAGL